MGHVRDANRISATIAIPDMLTAILAGESSTSLRGCITTINGL